MKQIDLYLGGDLGIWALQKIDRESVAKVFTLDEQIVDLSQKYNLEVETSNPNSINFQPSPIGFSVHYPRIFRRELISKYDKTYNLHPGYLPWGRGYYPIFWSLWEDTPAGATLHEINEGIDTGPIVEQIQVKYDEADTGGSLFQRVRQAEKELFIKYCDCIIKGETLESSAQAEGGSYHAKKEFFQLKQQANWESMNGQEVIKLIRCLTFPPHTGLEISLGNQKFTIGLEKLIKS
jgi:methionyl-tRNA formyltransferase